MFTVTLIGNVNEYMPLGAKARTKLLLCVATDRSKAIARRAGNFSIIGVVPWKFCSEAF